MKVSALVRATKLSMTNPNARTETDTVIRLFTRLWQKLIKTMGTRINAPPANAVMAAAKAATENDGAIGGRPYVLLPFLLALSAAVLVSHGGRSLFRYMTRVLADVGRTRSTLLSLSLRCGRPSGNLRRAVISVLSSSR